MYIGFRGDLRSRLEMMAYTVCALFVDYPIFLCTLGEVDLETRIYFL